MDQYELASTQTAFDLKIGDSTTWSFWFRDLPLAGGVYNRHRDEHVEDINDPEALAGKENFLLGYEWRLSAKALEAPPLSLHGLHFFPLTLEKLAFQGNVLDTIELTGRLQLPLPGGQESEGLANAVRLTFKESNGAIALKNVASDIKPPVPPAPLPLRAEGGEAGNAPRLEWASISYDPAKHQVIMTGVRLRFALLEKVWTLALGSDLRFPMQTPLFPSSLRCLSRAAKRRRSG